MVPIIERSVGKAGKDEKEFYLFEKAGVDNTGSGLQGVTTWRKVEKRRWMECKEVWGGGG